MKISRRTATIGGLSLTAAASFNKSAKADGLMEDMPDAFWTAVDAYTFGYPLVTMEYTRRDRKSVV